MTNRKDMGKTEITVNGKAYPCRQTMGAMLRFRRETGRDITEMDGSLSDMCVFLWCCVASACQADGVEFGLSLMDFADSVAPDDMASWAESAGTGAAGGTDEKKSR